MFHILTNNAVPNYLTADSTVQCGLQSRREAVSVEDFRRFVENKTLNKKQVCKACFRKVAGYKLETED